MTTMSANSKYYLSNDQPFSRLECQTAFEGLSEKEQKYAHHLSRASWLGSLTVLLQTSPESPLIFVLLHRMFRQQNLSDLKQIALDKCSFTDDEWKALLVYAGGFYGDMGNYHSFGDTKKVPGVSRAKLESLVRASAAYSADEKLMERVMDGCMEKMYLLDDKVTQLGLSDKGVTTYFSANCNEQDSQLVTAFMKEKNIEFYNNRLFKTVKDNVSHYEIRLASVLDGSEEGVTLPPQLFNGAEFTVTRGDYTDLLALTVEELKLAKESSLTDHERNMLEQYIASFTTGSLAAHKDGSRHWIKNMSPPVETYIGFIETYRDPTGMRGEFEGFAAMVNRKMSEKFTRLVGSAESVLPKLPWPKEYEKDVFLKPDFTSLDVLTFAGSGVPAGINIPNYDEIRQSEGFKNVSLGNVITASYQPQKVAFLSAEDNEYLNKYRIDSFEIQVGLHELFGHGSGKLFTKDKDGVANIDVNSMKHAVTDEPITSFYQPGETYDSVFGDLGSAYEECRAEAVGLYLCLVPEVMDVFDVDPAIRSDMIYTNWLSLLHNAMSKALEMYSTETGKFMQAHSQARFVILRVLLEHGDGVVSVESCTDAEGQPDLLLSLDRDKIYTTGKKALEDFLLKLQVYKSTADITSARSMFAHYSRVDTTAPHPFASWLDVIMKRRKPRRYLVQAHTSLESDGRVLMRQYDATAEGMIQSYVDRFSDPNLEDMLLKLQQKDSHHF